MSMSSSLIFATQIHHTFSLNIIFQYVKRREKPIKKQKENHCPQYYIDLMCYNELKSFGYKSSLQQKSYFEAFAEDALSQTVAVQEPLPSFICIYI